MNKRKIVKIVYGVIIFMNYGVFPVYTLDWYTELKNNFIRPESKMMWNGNYGYKRVHNSLVVTDGLPTPQEEIFPLTDLVLSDTGYLTKEITIEGYEPHGRVLIKREILHYFIPGDEYLLVFPDTLGTGSSMVDFSLNRYSADFWENEKYYIPNTFYAEGLKNNLPEYHKISYSSALSETIGGVKYTYNGANMCRFFLTFRYGLEYYNPYAMPWVEAAEGYGIGEWLQIELPKAQKTFYILNGFVDPVRRDLYKKNSRIKEAKIRGKTATGKELEQEVRFEDIVYFKTVEMEEAVLSFTIEIKSVYPGSEWQDTAVSTILLSKEEYGSLE